MMEIINLYSNDSDFQIMKPTLRNKNWLVEAHRGNIYGTSLPENSIGAYKHSFEMGADIIETDARASSDGVLFANHDATVTDIHGITYTIASTNSSTLSQVVIGSDPNYGTQYLPKLEDVLKLCYKTGMMANIDLKNGSANAVQVAQLVRSCGMLGKVMYATNGAGVSTINDILAVDEKAQFIDTYANYSVIDPSTLNCHINRLIIYTGSPDQSLVNQIRSTGCKLLVSERNASNYVSGFGYYPDIVEYQHTVDFKTLEKNILEGI